VFGVGSHGVYGQSGQIGVRAQGVGQGTGVQATGLTAVEATGDLNGVVAAGDSYGVRASSTNTGVYGTGGMYGLYGESTTGLAGYFLGNVIIDGNFEVANGTKNFLIDHPLDPANRTLAHACVEADEALNVYSGTATLDDKGRAVIRLPRYVAPINRDFRYQLTAIGGPSPNLHVAREVDGGRFVIAGGGPGQKVCWIVTGVRDDPAARKHPLRVERRKRRADRGKYLSPELYGESRSDAIHRPPPFTKPVKPRKAPKLPKPPDPPTLSDLPRMRRRRRRAAVSTQAVG
jgi:hypothetical protein